jgi:hypothetical protein
MEPNAAERNPVDRSTPPAVDPGAPPLEAPGDRVIDYYTGELGKKVLDSLRTRVEAGKFGPALALLAPSGGQTGSAATPTVSSPPPVRDSFVDPLANPSTTAASTPKLEDRKMSPLMPGVVFIGQGRQRDLLAKARQEGLELLVLLDVGVTTTRTQTINKTKFILLDVSTGKPHFTSRELNAYRIETLRKDPKNKEPDPVDDTVTRLADAIEKNYALSPLPAGLNAQSASNRVTKLAESKPDDMLETLAELTLYGYKQLVTPEQLKPAFEKLIGAAEGAKLVGPPVEQREALSKLLPKIEPSAPASTTATDQSFQPAPPQPPARTIDD